MCQGHTWGRVVRVSAYWKEHGRLRPMEVG